MKKYLLSVAAILLLTGYASFAQENNDVKREKAERNKDRMKEYEEIIIKRKDLKKDIKVVIEIRDDVVIVDGKPIDEFVNDQISIQKRLINRFKLTGPSSQFRFNENDWSLDMPDDTGRNKPFLGVSTEGSKEGTTVIHVSENSAAAKAGLQKDDIITKINDKPVFDQEQLSDIISELKPEDKITITYKRAGKENKTTAILGKRPMPMIIHEPHIPIQPMPPMNFNFDNGDFGETFRNLGGRPRLGIKAQDTEDGKGVKVLDVDEGSAADKAGIREDDIITSFEGKDVNSVDELSKASRESREKTSIKIQLKRNGKPQTIEIKVPKKLKTANL